MSTITSLGVGSGLDLEGTLSSLMEVEKQPLTRLAQKQSSYETELSAYSMVQSAISTFEGTVSGLCDISKYQKTNAGSTNTDIATISASSTAPNGSYSLKVSQLAQSQSLVANGVEDKKVAIGSGKIAIDFGEISGGTLVDGKYTGATFESNNKGIKYIEINESNNTLEGIRDAINAAGIGVTASIVNDGSDNPYRLVLTNDATGKEQSMKISVDGDAALGDLLNYDPADVQKMEQTQAAQNAEFTLNGIKISKASNSVSDAVDGVTINLLKADPDESTFLTVSRDTSGAKKAVEEMVQAYNDLMTTLKDLTKYDAESETSSVLTGDSAVRSIQTEVKSMLSHTISGGVQGYRMLSDVGISVNKDGVLEIDSSKLGEALDKNFDAFTAMFAEGGLSSNPAISFEDAADYAKTGTFDVEIKQVATKGTYEFTLVDGKLDFSSNDAPSRTMQVTVDGLTKSITLDAKNYGTAKEFAADLQSKINTAFKDTDANVSVEVEDGKFTVTSSAWGSGSAVKITETGGLFANQKAVDGLDVEGTINGQDATGKGQTLTGASGTDAYGIKLKVTGEDSNIKGTISFTQGFAYQFTKLAESLQGEGSAIQSRIDGVNKSIERVQKDYTNMQERIAAREEIYRQQFINLDMLIANLNSTSAYLTQQLASISSMWDSKD